MNPLQFHKCLADETRLKCLLLIFREEELCVCELTAALAESQPKISRHLAQLRQCGLLTSSRQGQWMFYRLNPELPAWAREVLSACARGTPDFITANLEALTAMGSRPQRVSACC